MDVGHSNGWRMDDVVPAAEIVAPIDAELAARAGRAELPRRGRRALALPRRQRRDRRDRLGHAAVLRRLHARAALRGGAALHLPLRRPRPRPARARCAAAPRTRSSRRDRARSGSARDDRYSEIRSAETADLPQGRDALHRRLRHGERRWCAFRPPRTRDEIDQQGRLESRSPTGGRSFDRNRGSRP